MSDTSGNNIDTSGNEIDTSGNEIDTSGNLLKDLVASSKNDDDSSKPLFVRVFNNSYVMFMVWFLAIYLVVYVLFGVMLNPSRDPQSEKRFSSILDIIAFGSIFLMILYVLYSNGFSTSGLTDGIKTFLKDFYGNQLSLFSTMLFLLTFYLLIFLLRVPSGGAKPWSIRFIELFGLLFLVSVFIYDVFKYLLGIDMLDFLGNPTVKKLLKSTGAPVSFREGDQVFNVSNNFYTYDDAQAVCKAFDSRLATYDEIEKAYDNGAEWCNYGWSEGQMAYFPTQKETWNKLQKNELHKNSCGRPGINGGYFENPYIKFGVNCFGKKPKPTDLEKQMMQAQIDEPIPQTEEEIALQEKVKYYQENGDQLLQVNSFNKKKWSRY